MTDKEKRELKNGVISIFKRFNILDHTATIGGLRDNILRYINYLQEKPVSEELEEVDDELYDEYVRFLNYHKKGSEAQNLLLCARHFANWQKKQMEKEYSDLNKGLVSAKGVAVYMAYETGKKEVISKACKYLQEHREEVETEDNGISGWISNEFIEKFSKYLEE